MKPRTGALCRAGLIAECRMLWYTVGPETPMNRQEDVDMHGYKIFWWSLCVLLCIAPSAQGQARAADTVRMKNGSILHGVVARFENGMFTVIIPGTQSRAMVHVDDVERIEFAADKSATASSAPVTPPLAPRMDPGTNVADASKTPSAPTREQQRSSNPTPSERLAESNQIVSTQERSAQSAMAREPASSAAGKQTTGSTEPIKSAPSAATPPVSSSMSTAEPTAGKPGAREVTSTEATTAPNASPRPPAVRELTVRVAGNEVWVDSGLDVRPGDTIRLSASGRVQLSRSQATGPEGVNIADPQKMMPNRPTGGLIAVIGDDNDDFIFIGAGAQIQARRSGRLFLMVNENVLEDNTGAFTVRIQVQSAADSNRE